MITGFRSLTKVEDRFLVPPRVSCRSGSPAVAIPLSARAYVQPSRIGPDGPSNRSLRIVRRAAYGLAVVCPPAVDGLDAHRCVEDLGRERDSRRSP